MIKAVWFGAVVVSLLGIPAVTMSLLSAHANWFFRINDLHGVENRIGITFPVDAVLVDGRYTEGFLNPTLFAVVRMPRSRVSTFVRARPARISHSERFVRNSSAGLLGPWAVWRPDDGPMLVSLAYDAEPIWAQISPSDGDACIVYVIWEML